MADILKQTAQLDALTDKQREVLALVSEGMTSKEIARKLGISESAVNQRIEVIRQRLGGLSRAQIARIYRQTSTLVITIPTSNSLTGKPIQLHDEAGSAQQIQPEGVDVFKAPADEAFGELQPSNLPPLTLLPAVLHGPAGPLLRLAAIAVLAAALLAAAVLILTVVHALGQFGAVAPG